MFLASFLRNRGVHLPMGFCRVATMALLRPRIWRHASWLPCFLWSALLWVRPSFPERLAEAGKRHLQPPPSGEAATSMDIDADDSIPTNLLHTSAMDDAVDVRLAHLFGEDVSRVELLAQELVSPPPQAAPVFFCPVAGCPRHCDSTRFSFSSFAALRAHVDIHLSTELPGHVSEDWLNERQLTTCSKCGLSVSKKMPHRMHHIGCTPDVSLPFHLGELT